MSSTWWTGLLLLAEFLFRVGVILYIVVHGPRLTSSRLTWILLILVLPVLGVGLYLLLGKARLGSGRLRRHAEIVNRVRSNAEDLRAAREPVAIAPEYDRASRLAVAVGGMPPRMGNDVQLLADTPDVVDALVSDIDAAQAHCHLLYYIYLTDETGRRIGEALARAVERGVVCRLLVDSVGSREFLASPFCAEIRRLGVQVVGALPARLVRAMFARIDIRNHRKLAVIDGVIGYTGSHNVADASFAPKPQYAPWVDATLRLRGPAVHDLLEIFIEDWYLDSEESLESLLEVVPPAIPDGVPVQVLPTGPDEQCEALQQLAQAAFHLAESELVLTTPYFVPGDAEVSALATAARRGVSVKLVVPRRNDSLIVAAASRSHYDELLDAGVEIHEYEKGLLHAKTFTVDGAVALVGTANFDRRSFELNFEVSALIYDRGFAHEVRALQMSYIADSRRVDLDVWRLRSGLLRVFENSAGLFGALL